MSVWRGQRAWNGVSILSPGGYLYAPGNPQPGPQLDYKMQRMTAFEAHAAEPLGSGLPVVPAVDLNVVPIPFGMYETTSYETNALVQPGPHEAYQRLLDQGWVDTIRPAFPKQQIFAFWDYAQRWERNAGLRLDHILVPKKLVRRLTEAGIDRPVRGWDNASDHAPMWVELKD